MVKIEKVPLATNEAARELTDAELEAVAGGKDVSSFSSRSFSSRSFGRSFGRSFSGGSFGRSIGRAGGGRSRR